MTLLNSCSLAATALGLAALSVPPASAKDPPTPEPRTIELAICLDTSGSMSGLIESAKQKLWAIVNELALAEPTPKLRVALLTYGNNGHSAAEGWVRVDSPFTDDLDLISQQLFALTTNGGTEYVGRVLHWAGGLDWSPSDDALKLAVVAGNESADQDRQMPYTEVCRTLIAQGIMVNAIYCGPETDSIAPGWREVARLTDGQFAFIDHDHGTIVVETPFDEELTALSTALNATYVPFGAAGGRGWANQAAQDENAKKLNSAVAASRAQTKAQALYHCAWDLVDACRNKQVVLAELKDEDLPEPMQGMSLAERQAYVDEMAAQRAGIQKQITELSVQRRLFVAQEMKAKALDEGKAFDSVLRKAIRAQASAKGFRFAEEAG